MDYAPIAVRGFAQTNFGELWGASLADLLNQACIKAVDNSGLKPGQIDAIYVANMASGNFEYQMHLNSLVSSTFPHHPPSFRIEAACASGGLAVISATHALHAGVYQNVLVVGAEKMTDVPTDSATKILAGAADTYLEYGSTFPGLYALLADIYRSKYKVSEPTLRTALSVISSRAHSLAKGNQYAQFRKSITPTVVSSSPIVADPLRVLDCSPLSDGAAALVLSLDPYKKKFSSLPHLIGAGHAQDTLSLGERHNLPHLTATKNAIKQALSPTGLTPSDIAVVELHDCFTIAEILAIEDLGFLKAGTAINTLVSQGLYRPGLTINPSGGLKACGHPVGATGVKQVGVIANYLNAEATPTNYGLTHNVGGTGGTVVIHLIEKGEL